MARKQAVRVAPKGDKWQVKTDGASRAAKITETKKEATEVAKGIAKNKKTELIIESRKGQIQSKDSYGNDPNPPKDKEH